MTNKVKTTRNLKVIEQSGYRYQATPTVMLKGKWLSEFGFDIGMHVKVECEDGKVVYEPKAAEPVGIGRNPDASVGFFIFVSKCQGKDL